jgi:protein-tyrosine phosphatase
MNNEWHNWEKVTKHVREGHNLYRSSSPNYRGYDESQTLTPTAVKFLKDNGTDSIISFNKHPYNDYEKELLDNEMIQYLHLPVQDFTAATVKQLENAIAFFNDPEHRSTLVHCGYGKGRTGTAVTALQLDATGGNEPDESVWQSENHVERPVQMEVLKKLKAKIKEDNSKFPGSG